MASAERTSKSDATQIYDYETRRLYNFGAKEAIAVFPLRSFHINSLPPFHHKINFDSMMQSELHSNAITLNNLGVFLLQQGASEQALETLHDALDTLRVSYDESTLTTPEKLVKCALDAGDRIEKAAEKVLHPMRAMSPLSVELVSWEDMDDNPPTTATPYGAVSLLAFSLDASSDVSQRDREIDAAIFCHNFALAHLALMSGSSTPARLNSGALSLLRMSCSFLFKAIDEGLEDGGDDDWMADFSANRLSTLAVAIMSNLVFALLNEGLDTEARAFQQKLLDIVQSLSAVEEVQTAFCRAPAAAAA
jgi:hypothetical protein